MLLKKSYNQVQKNNRLYSLTTNLATQDHNNLLMYFKGCCLRVKFRLIAMQLQGNREFYQTIDEDIKVIPPTKEERILAQELIAEGFKKAEEQTYINSQEAWEEFECIREKFLRKNQNS